MKKITISIAVLLILFISYKIVSTSSVEDGSFFKLTNSKEEKQITKSVKHIYNPDQPLSTKNHPHVIHKSDAATNPHLATVIEALDSGKYPERLSPQIAPKPFDYESWKKNTNNFRSTYLQTIEPSRIHFHKAKPGPKVKAIRSKSADKEDVKTGDTVELIAQAAPNSPVTWFVSSGGLFTESKLNTVTTLSDSNGIAKAHWYAAPGATEEVEISASSPFNASMASFFISISNQNSNLGEQK